ncbi:hypothetical protein [Mammaliicoccus sciuri]|uniref:hypothetical protein n=2 Tax=Staphylococcaceae TaxID=90964 RepID=UPI00289980D5|nr:hypothetical protein [Mammaliicoccus sciuri]
MKRLIIGSMMGISIGVIASIIFSLVFANTKYQPISPNSTMGTIYSNNLSEIQIMMVSQILTCICYFFIEKITRGIGGISPNKQKILARSGYTFQCLPNH